MDTPLYTTTKAMCSGREKVEIEQLQLSKGPQATQLSALSHSLSFSIMENYF